MKVDEEIFKNKFKTTVSNYRTAVSYPTAICM
jgi:hypothetical protein